MVIGTLVMVAGVDPVEDRVSAVLDRTMGALSLATNLFGTLLIGYKLWSVQTTCK